MTLKNLRISRLYDWCMRYASSKWSGWMLFAVAFADAAALAIPTPLFLLTAVLFNPEKAYRFAAFVVGGGVLGALVGYSIGHFLWLTPEGGFTSLAMLVFNHVPGASIEVYEMAKALFEKWDYWILFSVSFVPAPQTLMTVLAGVFDINIIIFMVVTAICQSVKYFAFTWCIVRFGARAKEVLESYYKPISIAIGVTLVVAISLYNLL